MRTVIAIISRMVLLLLLWWALTEGDLSGITFGLVIAALVTFISFRLFPLGTERIHLIPLVFFLLFFLSRSVVAGIDVARRLLSPSLPVDPGHCTVYLSLPEGSPRWLLANTMSLMPGTLSVELKDHRLYLHCLDISDPVEADVRALEKKVARVFGVALKENIELSEVNE